MMVNCLPSDSLISGKLLDDKYQQNDVLTSNNNSSDHINNANIQISNATHAKSRINSTTNELPDDQQRLSLSTNDLLTSRMIHKRVKRVHIFRPLFVYRQEKIKRRLIHERRLRIQERRLRSRNMKKHNQIDRSNEKKCKCYECRCN